MAGIPNHRHGGVSNASDGVVWEDESGRQSMIRYWPDGGLSLLDGGYVGCCKVGSTPTSIYVYSCRSLSSRRRAPGKAFVHIHHPSRHVQPRSRPRETTASLDPSPSSLARPGSLCCISISNGRNPNSPHGSHCSTPVGARTPQWRQLVVKKSEGG